MTDPIMAICLIENPDPVNPAVPTMVLFNLTWLFNDVKIKIKKEGVFIVSASEKEVIKFKKEDLTIDLVGSEIEIEVSKDPVILSESIDPLKIEFAK